jgi:hypothetical protein
MSDVTSNEDYYLAQVKPSTDLTQLKVWWRRPLSPTFYTAYLVRLVLRSTSTSAKSDLLTFRLARNEDLGDFHVDLKDNPIHVWPDLPSTIQLATASNQYGFLLLSEEWETAEEARLNQPPRPPDQYVDLGAFGEGGGKWPIAAPHEKLLSLLNRVTDESLRKQFYKVLRLPLTQR